MLKYIQYTLAYISLSILWIYLIAIVLSIFDMINFDRGGPVTTTFIGFVLASIYHKYKPMEFKELIKKKRK